MPMLHKSRFIHISAVCGCCRCPASGFVVHLTSRRYCISFKHTVGIFKWCIASGPVTPCAFFLDCCLNIVLWFGQVMEDDEHYVDDPKNPQFQHHGGEYAYQGGNSGGDFEGEGFHGEHEGYEASGNFPIPGCGTDNTALCFEHVMTRH